MMTTLTGRPGSWMVQLGGLLARCRSSMAGRNALKHTKDTSLFLSLKLLAGLLFIINIRQHHLIGVVRWMECPRVSLLILFLLPHTHTVRESEGWMVAVNVGMTTASKLVSK